MDNEQSTEKKAVKTDRSLTFLYFCVGLLAIVVIMTTIAYGKHHYGDASTLGNAYRIVRVEDFDGRVEYRVEVAKHNDTWKCAYTVFVIRNANPNSGYSEEGAMALAVDYFNKLVKAKGEREFTTVVKEVKE